MLDIFNVVLFYVCYENVMKYDYMYYHKNVTENVHELRKYYIFALSQKYDTKIFVTKIFACESRKSRKSPKFVAVSKILRQKLSWVVDFF